MPSNFNHYSTSSAYTTNREADVYRPERLREALSNAMQYTSYIYNYPTYIYNYPTSYATGVDASSTGEERNVVYSTTGYNYQNISLRDTINLQAEYLNSFNWSLYRKPEPFFLSAGYFLVKLKSAINYFKSIDYVKVPVKVSIKDNIFFSDFFDKEEYFIDDNLRDLMNIFYYENICDNKEIRKYFNKEKKNFFNTIKEQINKESMQILKESIYLRQKPKQLELI